MSWCPTWTVLSSTTPQQKFRLIFCFCIKMIFEVMLLPDVYFLLETSKLIRIRVHSQNIFIKSLRRSVDLHNQILFQNEESRKGILFQRQLGTRCLDFPSATYLPHTLLALCTFFYLFGTLCHCPVVIPCIRLLFQRPSL